MIKFGKRDKKEKLSDFDKRQMLKHGQLPDESDWDLKDVQFIKDVRSLDPDGHTVLQILQVEPLDRLDFLDDLKQDIAEKKRRTELGLDKADAQAAEIERKRVEEAAAAKKRIDETKRQADAERHEREVQAAAEATNEAARKKQETTDERRSKLPKKVNYDRYQDALVADPAVRKQRSANNLKTILDWLRQEPYSTIAVMAVVMRMSVAGARNALKKAHKEGWLVNDKVAWPGVPGKMNLYGISANGLYHLLDVGDVEPPPDRDFKRGRTRVSSGAHVLNIQLARMYHQRINNPDHDFRLYTAARDLPNYGEQHYRWETYPDAVFKDSHIFFKGDKSRGLTVAVEIEQHGKGSKRYKYLIQAHIQNIESNDYAGDANYSDRYDMVIYYLPNSAVAANRKLLFHKLIDKRYGDVDVAAGHKARFRFDTYENLAERVRALG